MSQFLISDFAADWGILLLRVVVGVIFIVHGLPKVKMPEALAKALGWPKGVALLQGVVEVLAGAALILGYFVSWASLALSVIMVGAILAKIVKWKTPFMAYDKAGWEFDLLLLAANAVIFLSGGGALGIGI